MPRHRKPRLEAQAHRTNAEQLARVGMEVRASRRRRGLTQARLGGRVGLAQPTISDLERGHGGTLSLDTWQRVVGAVDRRLVVELSRDPMQEPVDAGHLAMQELVMRLTRRAGYAGTFELQSRSLDRSRWTDIGLVDAAARRLLLIECVNVFGDVGASIRSSDRKRVEAEAYAIAVGHGREFNVHSCWVIRATARNRQLVARYPELFASRFPGSSVAWVRALTTGGTPPPTPGLVWCDARCTRLFAWRPLRA